MDTFDFSTLKTPQSEPISDDQVQNHAGGYVYAVSPEDLLDRFLILGTSRPTYYASGTQMTREAMAGLVPLIRDRGPFVADVPDFRVCRSVPRAWDQGHDGP